MVTLFRLDASIFPQSSTTRTLADRVEAGLRGALPDGGLTVTRRDIVSDPVPATAWSAGVTASFTPEDQRSEAQRDAVALASTLADELIGADAAVIAVPLYNWGPSQHVKAWVDHLITDPRFGPREQPLAGRPVVLVTARGGTYAAGTPRAEWDHATGWYERILRDAWGADLRTVGIELTLADHNEFMAHLRDQAAEARTAAERLADEQGAWLAERLAVPAV